MSVTVSSPSCPYFHLLSHGTTQLLPGEVIDASTMSVEDLCEFYEREITDAKESDILLSLVSIGVYWSCLNLPNRR